MTTHNRLLGRLLVLDPALEEHIAAVAYAAGHEHVRPGVAPTHALFPSGGVLSFVLRLDSGAVAEVNAVGNEGLYGVASVLGKRRSPFLVVQQVPGVIERIPLRVLRDSVARHRRERALLDRYAMFQIMTANQLAVCRALHPMRARAARWILATADRVGASDYRLTQELLAQMLGASRQMVSTIAADFRRAGLIDYRRGRVLLLHRARLHREACECYGQVRRQYAAAVGRNV